MPDKKVCMILYGHSVLDARITYKEAESLRSAGYEVHVVGRLGRDGHFYDMSRKPVFKPNDSGQVCQREGIYFHGVGVGSGIRGRIAWVREATRICVKLDAWVYHCHEVTFALWVAIRVKKILKNRCRLIFDSHEYHPGGFYDLVPMPFNLIVQSVVAAWERYALQYSDGIITANSIVRGHLLTLNRYLRAEVLYNGPLLSLLKEQEEIEKDGIYVCHEGSLRFNRGLKEMVSMVDSLRQRDVKLYIVGDVFGNERKWLDREIRNKGLEDSIITTGWLPYEEVGNAIGMGDIGLITMLPTKNNMLAGPPNKLFNYMRYGLPIVSVDFPEIRSIIQHHRCGILYDYKRPESLVKAVNYLLDYPDQAREMGERGKQAVLQEYSWERQSLKLLRFYKELMNEADVVK